jgi:hypothetical protein
MENQLELYQSRPQTIRPQSGGALLGADAVFSSLPRILSDAAASRVLFFIWSKEGPKDLSIRPGEPSGCKIEALNRKAVESFKSIVLRVWYAFNSPYALPDRFAGDETPEAVYQRELVIRSLAGIPILASAELAKAASLTASESSATLTQTAVQATLASSVGGTLSRPPSNSTLPAAPVSKDPTMRQEELKRIEAAIDFESRGHTPFNTRELIYGGSTFL